MRTEWRRRTVSSTGFTLVEIMIVVAIIGLLAAIAIPSFVRARQESQEKACMNNLRQIDSAVEQWALDFNLSDGAVPNMAVAALYMKKMPECPASGSYTQPVVGGPEVSCTAYNATTHAATF